MSQYPDLSLRMMGLLTKLGWRDVLHGLKPDFPKNQNLKVYTRDGFGTAIWNGENWTAGGIVLPNGIVWFYEMPAQRG